MRFAALSVSLALAATLASSAPAPAQQPEAKPDLDKAKATATQICAACHGPDGNSPTPVNPSLAGMPAEYISTQLAHFKAGIRVNPIMQGMAAPLSPSDMQAIGVHFSQQKPKGNAAKDPDLVQAGQKLYRAGDMAAGVPACAGCHSPDGAGMPKNYPRLAGQHADYTYAQLKAFKAGERGNDPQGKDANGRIMATIASRLTDAQMKAAAEYVSGLR
jgi:cytochrome c553